MVCDKPSAGVIARAERYGVETFVFSPRDYASRDQWESLIADLLDSRGVELVCLAGYMRIVGGVLLERYRDRIINIHPSLLPSVKGAHAIALLTEWDSFRKLDYRRIYDLMEKPAFLFDGRNLLDHRKLYEIGFNVYPIGQKALTHF